MIFVTVHPQSVRGLGFDKLQYNGAGGHNGIYIHNSDVKTLIDCRERVLDVQMNHNKCIEYSFS